MKFSFCLAALCLAACGGDPLIGTWSDVEIPTGATAYNETYTFKSDKTFSLSLNVTIDHNQTDQPGCTISDTFSGTWTDTVEGDLTTTATAGTLSASGCDHPTTDDASPFTADDSTLSGVSHDSTYSISGSTLTLTNDNGTASFTK